MCIITLYCEFINNILFSYQYINISSKNIFFKEVSHMKKNKKKEFKAPQMNGVTTWGKN